MTHRSAPIPIITPATDATTRYLDLDQLGQLDALDARHSTSPGASAAVPLAHGTPHHGAAITVVDTSFDAACSPSATSTYLSGLSRLSTLAKLANPPPLAGLSTPEPRLSTHSSPPDTQAATEIPTTAPALASSPSASQAACLPGSRPAPPSLSATPPSTGHSLRSLRSLRSLHSLHLQTHSGSAVDDSTGPSLAPSSRIRRPSTLVLKQQTSSSSLRPVCRTPSFHATGFHGFGTSSAASSTVPSPVIAAMADITPLPSPLLSSDSPGPWKRLAKSPPREPAALLAPGRPESALVTSNGELLSAALKSMSKRKAYTDLLASNGGQSDGQDGRPQSLPAEGGKLKPPHTRDRSLSEYIPEHMQIPKRMVTVSAMHNRPDGDSAHVDAPYEGHMRREPHLSEARGLTPLEKPPTPPPSESSLHLSDTVVAADQKPAVDTKRHEFFEAKGRADGKRRRWRSLKLLGQGTFSRVMLATSQIPADEDDLSTQEPHARYDRRTLVAVKVCEHGPKGGASEERVEMSLKRELEIMRCIRHPSLVHLKAWNIEPSRAILVLSYCPGGDLFDVASIHRNLLTPPLLARIFAELVGAVSYLHGMRIVHRDIKLENVLVNLTPQELGNPSIDWKTYPYSVTTLTDLGLSRHVADDEKLETRCGSDDYAAPEVIMGQPYDGHAIDAWSLGVLLYALLEGRLPFDPTPGMSDAHRMRSRTSHRIARVEWRWVEYAGDEGDHEGDAAKFEAANLLDAMRITEGLLKRARSRWSLTKVADDAWVRNAISLDGGLRFREEEEGEEVV